MSLYRSEAKHSGPISRRLGLCKASWMVLSVQYKEKTPKRKSSLMSSQVRLLVGQRQLLVHVIWICGQVSSVILSDWVFCIITYKHTRTATCVTHAHARGLVLTKPLPTQPAGRSNARGCLHRFSQCFTLNNLVTNTHLGLRAVRCLSKENAVYLYKHG